MARVALLQDDQETALACVEQILDHLESGSLDGMSEPFAVYLTCHRVLVANHDPRAHELISKSFILLQQQAKRIGDNLNASGYDRPILFSSKTRIGRDEIWARIRTVIASREEGGVLAG